MIKYGVLLVFIIWVFMKDPLGKHQLFTFNYSQVEPTPKSFNVMTYNIGFGAGLQGLDGRLQPESVIRDNLDGIVDVVKRNDIDILAVQEIDLRSRRSHGIDQIRYIAKQCGFNYVAFAVTWNKNWVPYPLTWKVWHQFGKVLAGQAIFSKYPLKDQQIQILEKPINQSWAYNFFYLDRVIQTVQVAMPDGKQLSVSNVHLEAFDSDTRELHLNHVKTVSSDIVLGDFNQSGLSPLDGYRFGHDVQLTYPSNVPEESLDYIVIKEDLPFQEVSLEVQNETCSDHLPLAVQIGL